MVNSSPEYTITKPGVNPHERKRHKLLRTYGKRPAPDAPSDIPPKRTCIERASSNEQQQADEATTIQRSESQEVHGDASGSEPEVVEDVVFVATGSRVHGNRASILRYFKPVGAPKPKVDWVVAETGASDGTTDTAQPAQPRRTRSGPRLLRIRSQPVHDAHPWQDDLEESRAHHRNDGSRENGAQLGYNNSQSNDVAPMVRKEGKLETTQQTARDHGQGTDSSPARSHLEEGRALHNRQLRRASASDKPERGPRWKAKRIVQTTLNISTQAAFSECKTCDTVWNPLYPDDVTYHMKRHKAVLRAKRKREAERL